MGPGWNCFLLEECSYQFRGLASTEEEESIEEAWSIGHEDTN